ncbi:rhodopsin [Penaeus vannamei]|uniref:Rhodopsin n=1 Tax=Penaeus vannamei TaxID=6689 RepID=A0A423SQX5_PENVA|nr:rhodopsin [Penaeus vannamei]
MFPPMVVSCYWQTWTLGALFCEIYAFLGSLFGCASIWTMVFITADRYNVIVKGVSAEPLRSGGAMLRIAGTWFFSFAWCLPPFFGWNRYVPEGNMTACGTDYLTESELSKSYLYVYSVWVYIFPLFYIIYSYTFIVKAVAAHEKGMREQAKKMGVKSLRSEEAQKTSAECRLCKANAVYNPIVYAISHPKYRAALEKKLPCLACNTEGRDGGGSDAGSTATAENNEKAESA